MREESKSYAREAMDIVEHAAHKIGSRLPGSDGEIKFHQYMGDKLRDIGIEPKTEEFAVSPRSGIGGLSYAGWSGVILSIGAIIALACGFNKLWYALAALGLITIFWLVMSCFFYKTWFDMFFPQEISRNTLGVLEPEDGKYDYTIILSGHTDTSWCWRHSEHAYKYAKTKPIMGLIATYGKVGFGAVCFFFIALFSVFMAVVNICDYAGAQWAQTMLASQGWDTFMFIMNFVPIVTAIGSLFVVMWGDPNPRNASRGAMDNATGIGLSYAVIKYFKEHPEKMPKNCRIVDANIGSEEAGLRGSMHFAQEHRFDDLSQNAWNINIDSVADKEYFEVATRGVWRQIPYTQDSEQILPPSLLPSPEVYFATCLQDKEVWPIWQYLEEYDEQTLFSVIEILYDHIGVYNYETDQFENEAQKEEFAEQINNILRAYKEGYYLEPTNGFIMQIPNGALREQLEYDGSDLPDSVYEQLATATEMYYRFDANLEQKKKAINILADILESEREEVKDTLNAEYEVPKNEHDKLIFGIVNGYNIRHNRADQKDDYSKEIWYDWMMQYYTSVIIAFYKLQNKHTDIDF